MKHIMKRDEPASLTQHKLQRSADFDNYTGKDELRAALLGEQGGICCYCMGRMSMKESKIEHWACQARHADRQLDYGNLLLACPGGEGMSAHLQHCDTHKRDQEITVCPADRVRNCEQFIKYAADGKMYSDHAPINNDLNSVLNLNLDLLKRRREAVLNGAVEALQKKRPDGQWTRRYLENEKSKLLNCGGDGFYNPYCMIVVAYLDKKLNQLSSSK